MDNNKPGVTANHQEFTRVPKQVIDKGLVDASFRFDRPQVPKGFLSALKPKHGGEQESGPSNKKRRSANSNPSLDLDGFMDQDDSFVQLMNKLNKPQFIKSTMGESSKTLSGCATSKLDNSSFHSDEGGKSQFGIETNLEARNDSGSWKDKTMETGAELGDVLSYNANQRGKDNMPSLTTVKNNVNKEDAEQSFRLESEGLLTKTLSVILKEERQMFENWGKILSKSEACEIKLLQRSEEALSRAECVREQYEERKDKFQRKLSQISNILTKTSK